ncbi:MAG: DUF488 domain-containing protein, partial [Candidatus Deferrimicrobiaceae bacterium]
MRIRSPKIPPSVLTVGHSTRNLGEFVSLLLENEISRVVDIRTVPRSRHNPQFNGETLPVALEAAGIKYLHLPELGGLRHSRGDSPNGGWRNASFRGFADHMQTEAFASSVERLLELAKEGRIALMCAEVVPWRCHRSLIADALVALGIPVEHILGKGPRKIHALSPLARGKG